MKKIIKTLLGLSVAALLASCGCAQQQTPTSSSHDTGLSSSESSKQTDLSSSESTHQTGISSSDTTQSSSSESTQSTQSSESTQSTGTSESSQSSESSSQPASKVVTAIIGDLTVTLNENTQTDKTDGRLAEYYAEGLDVIGGQSVIMKIDGVEITQNIGPDAYAQDNNLEMDQLNNIVVHNDADGASLYFKVYENGYALVLTGYEEDERADYEITTVTDDEETTYTFVPSEDVPEGWDAQYQVEAYLTTSDEFVIKGVKNNATFSYAQLENDCKALFNDNQGKAVPKANGYYKAYLKVKTQEGALVASIWVEFTEDYDYDFASLELAYYGQDAEANPTIISESVESALNEVKFIIPSAEDEDLVEIRAVDAQGQVAQDQPTIKINGHITNNAMAELNGYFDLKKGGQNIEVYVKAVGDNELSVYVNGYTPTKDTEETADPYYVVGTLNDWEPLYAGYGLAKMGEDQKKDGHDQYESDYVNLSAGDKIKIASKDKANYYPATGDGYAVEEDGAYKIYFVAEGGVSEWTDNGYFYVAKRGGEPDPQDPEEEVVYTVKIGDDNPIALVKNEEAELAEGQTGEYKLPERVDLFAGDVIVFSNDKGAITTGIGPDAGANVTVTEGVIAVKADIADAQIYFKTWETGLSYFVEAPEEPDPDGVYLQKEDAQGNYSGIIMVEDAEPLTGYVESYRLVVDAKEGEVYRGRVLITEQDGQHETTYSGQQVTIKTTDTLKVEDGKIKVKADGKYEFVIGVKVVNEGEVEIHVYANPVTVYNVDFSVTYNAGQGNGVYVIGDFNDWKAVPEYRLGWHDGNVWSGTFEFLAGTYEYKYAMAAYENPEPVVPAEKIITEGDNLSVTVPDEGGEGESEVGYVVLVNETPIDIADIKEQGSSNAAVYKVPAEDEDEIQIKKDGEFLDFYHWDGSANEGAGGAVSEGNKITATAKGHYVLWVNTDGKVYYDFMPTDEGITAKKGDEAIQLTNSRDLGSHDRGVYVVTLAADDVVTFKFGDVALHFYENVEDEAVDQGASYTATADGEYTFYVNGQNQIYVGAPEDLVATNLYVKFGVADSDKDRVYAWVWSNAEDGAWYYATHVDEEWTAENNRHYTISLANPVGKKVIVASFSSESGVDDENEPDGVWTGKIKQSAEATIADWGANAN